MEAVHMAWARKKRRASWNQGSVIVNVPILETYFPQLGASASRLYSL